MSTPIRPSWTAGVSSTTVDRTTPPSPSSAGRTCPVTTAFGPRSIRARINVPNEDRVTRVSSSVKARICVRAARIPSFLARLTPTARAQR